MYDIYLYMYDIYLYMFEIYQYIYKLPVYLRYLPGYLAAVTWVTVSHIIVSSATFSTTVHSVPVKCALQIKIELADVKYLNLQDA